jgi:hypothetical protein
MGGNRQSAIGKTYPRWREQRQSTNGNRQNVSPAGGGGGGKQQTAIGETYPPLAGVAAMGNGQPAKRIPRWRGWRAPGVDLRAFA